MMKSRSALTSSSVAWVNWKVNFVKERPGVPRARSDP